MYTIEFLSESLMSFTMKSYIVLAGLFFTALPTKAQPDESSYWFGFSAGAASTVCQLAKAGLIKEQDARLFMVGIMKGMTEDANTRKFKTVVEQSFDIVKANDQCAGIFNQP